MMTFSSARHLLAATLLLAIALAACGAPASEPATGAVGDAVLAAIESGERRFDHDAWDRMLRDGTRDGLVDYAWFQDHRADLDAYLERLQEVELASLAAAELMAVLINAYNALTIRAILDHPEVTSIRQIDGVWTETTHRVGGFDLTLDGIEHNLLRPYFQDPRIHFAVNCASRSCAPLPRWAFTGERLEEQLEERSRAFLTDPANVRIEDGTLLLSKYFDWYGDDFVAVDWEPRADSSPAFVALYSTDEVRAMIEAAGGEPAVRYLDYDWSLNAIVPPRTDG